MLSEVTHTARFTLEAGETFRFRGGMTRPEMFVTSLSLSWTDGQRPSVVALHGTLTAVGHTHKNVTLYDIGVTRLPEHVRRAVINITK